VDISKAHAILGVDPSIPIEEVGQRYRLRAQMLHPDRLVGKPGLVDEAGRAMAELNQAWKVVSSADADGTRMQGQQAADAAPSAQRYPHRGECDLCGTAPAADISLGSNVGLILVRRTKRITPQLCRRCGISLFRELQSETLVKGWWGIISAFVNVGTVLSNWSAIRGHRARLPEPNRRDPAVISPLAPGRPLARPVLGRPGPILATLAFAWLAFGTALGAISNAVEGGAAGQRESEVQSPVGSCLDESGYVADCDGSAAVYRITQQVPSAASCGSLEVFTSNGGNVYCATKLR